MATRPVVRNMNATSVGILNWIFAGESGYLAGAPLAEDTIQSIQQVGEFINAYQPRQNQFLSSLVNRIALVVIASKSYSNPWEWIKKGTLEYGESIEEIFVNLAKVERFKTGGSTDDLLSDLFGTRKPDVQAAFHQMNFQKKYPVTISEEQLRTAFTSSDGLNNLIEYIVQSLYTAFNYDELVMYQYLLGRLALDGKIKSVQIPEITSKDTAEEVVINVKGVSDEMTFMKADYNMAGVMTHSPKTEQYVLTSIKANNYLGVKVLASAFNMSEVEFTGHQVLMDSYDTFKVQRMNELLETEESGEIEAFTEEEIATLNKIAVFVVDKEFLMQYDKLVKMSEQSIPNELKWNYFLHHWALFSASPFKNACAFTSATSSITSVSVSPATLSVAEPVVENSLVQMTAIVEGTGLFNGDVVWSMTGQMDESSVSANGLVTLVKGETGTSSTITVKATSVQDATKYDTCVITILTA